MKNDNIVDFTVSKYMSQTLWHYFFRIIHDITTTNTTLVQTSIILGLVFKVLLSNDIYVFWCWPSVVGLHTFCVVQVENVQYINSMQMLHRASCTLPNIFHVLWARKYLIMIRKCATLCTRNKTYTNVFSMYHFMFNVKVGYFWAAMICKLFWASFHNCCFEKMVLVGVSEYVVYGIAQHVNSHWVLFWEILFGFSNEYLNCA